MRSTRTAGKLFILPLLALLATAAAQASVILDVASALDLEDPTQLGRLSRNGIPQDWLGDEPFPGVITTTVSYHYHAYLVNVGDTPFVQIEVDSVSRDTFVSAYDTSYLPDSAGTPNFGFDTNWLGDAGASGNLFGVDPAHFQVLVPQNHELLVIVNNTSGNAGIGDPFHLTVEGFIDSDFTNPPGVPEPTTVFVCGAGLALMALARRIRRKN